MGTTRASTSSRSAGPAPENRQTVISRVAGLLLVVSGLGVLAVLGLVKDERQRRLLRAVAWFDILAGGAVVALGTSGVLP